MISEILNADSEIETTAGRVVSYLAEMGVDRASICDKHLEPLYRALSWSANTPIRHGANPPQFDGVCKPGDHKVWGVIVETREHPALEYVVCQFSEQLGIGIQLFHSPANEKFIRRSRISDFIKQGKVVLTRLAVENLSLSEYNALFLSRDFWNALSGRDKILVFQTDAILCKRSDYKFSDFFDFDYIGSKWPRKRPVGLVIDGGSGGLSLRDWQKSVECLDRFSPELWAGGEDGYFAFHLDLIGGRVGRDDECARFSTQYEFLFRSFGGHKVTELRAPFFEKFLEYCPETRNILLNN